MRCYTCPEIASRDIESPTLFSPYVEHEQSNVKLGDRTSVKVVAKGDITLAITVNGEPRQSRLLNVLHVPDLGYQLFSVPTLDKQ